ncbi:hypothetical protein ASA1KI_10060 [Opitutales bacterium ASA1]|uniref:DUF3891 family protein n=1 Tax=Congregicoccus parvus TaxID=3081749 RepID=UPI002B2A9A31|nr:hypothetical protein ASA1KI_10060 [Opitutales bacterium ASA1]
MIRVPMPDGWLLVEHRNHARLAGEFARHWGNARFAPPEPRSHVVVAVARHDDAWAERDVAPSVAGGGEPAGFSRELVGTYSAFENIDLEDYLRVRGRATEAVAREDPYAAVLVSMHTVNLLTEQADPSALGAAQRDLLAGFVGGQRRRQEDLVACLRTDPAWIEAVRPERLRRAFEFLQACDSLSLAVCVGYPKRIALRHRQPTTDGGSIEIHCEPVGEGEFRVDPWPFDRDSLELRVPCRRVPGTVFANDTTLRRAYAAARVEPMALRLRP